MDNTYYTIIVGLVTTKSISASLYLLQHLYNNYFKYVSSICISFSNAYITFDVIKMKSSIW